MSAPSVAATPEGRERIEAFTARMIRAVEDLSLLFSHQPNDKVERELAKVRANLRADFVSRFPEMPWDAFLDYFIQCVRDRKAEIERQGAAGGRH